MATDVTDELQQFHQFIGQQLAGGSKMSVADAVAEFHKYQNGLELLRESLDESFARKERGEGKVLSIDAFKREMNEEWTRRQSGEET